jgi:hypothetical protein
MHLLSLTLLPVLTLAANFELYIPATAALPNPNVLPSSSHASLSTAGGPIIAPLTHSNTFIFTGIKPGSYLLSAHSRDAAFEDLRVDVDVNGEGVEEVKAWTTWRGNEWSNKGEIRGQGEGSAKIELRAVGTKDYYQQRASCKSMFVVWWNEFRLTMILVSIISIFKNPMILIALVTLVMVVGVPYMMENREY